MHRDANVDYAPDNSESDALNISMPEKKSPPNNGLLSHIYTACL